jgi:hypothetical protein
MYKVLVLDQQDIPKLRHSLSAPELRRALADYGTEIGVMMAFSAFDAGLLGIGSSARHFIC